MASVAEQYPAQSRVDGTTWYRPRRVPGAGVDQWGWTSDPRQAHPDYAAYYDAQSGGLHPAGLCGGDCTGCVDPGEGA